VAGNKGVRKVVVALVVAAFIDGLWKRVTCFGKMQF